MRLLFSVGLLLSLSSIAAANQNFRMIFTGIVGESMYTVEGMEDAVVQFYCPTYNTITVVRKADGQKVFDLKAKNCESVKSFISLGLISGSKPFAIYNPFDEGFNKWGFTNAKEGVCRYQ